MAEHSVDTRYGFEFGDMAVERLCSHKGYVAIRVRSRTTGRFVDVQMSPKGRTLRVLGQTGKAVSDGK